MAKGGRLIVVAGIALAAGIFLANWTRLAVPFWRAQVSPGRLSASHASLEGDCAACHTPLRSVESINCIGCHADDASLLQRQPTAFHAEIGACTGCHREHEETGPRPLRMDHVALAEIGLEAVRRNADNPSNSRLLAWIRQHEVASEVVPTHPELSPIEAALSCVACHSTKDRHQGYFGGDCASCHGTTAWGIAAFRHPPPRSVECVQCHQPPPSHRMMHFEMVSRSVARAREARVDQCFLCHQTTSWNDIQRAGWYKHH